MPETRPLFHHLGPPACALVGLIRTAASLGRLAGGEAPSDADALPWPGNVHGTRPVTRGRGPTALRVVRLGRAAAAGGLPGSRGWQSRNGVSACVHVQAFCPLEPSGALRPTNACGTLCAMLFEGKRVHMCASASDSTAPLRW